MSSDAVWYKLSTEERIKQIIRRSASGESYADMSEALLGSRDKKSTIWTWANRNVDPTRLKIARTRLRGEMSDADFWVIYDIITNFFPRLDASISHLLEELKNLQQEQTTKFSMTAGFLDSIEERLTSSISSSLRSLPRVAAPAYSAGPPRAPGPPGMASAPPLPPGGAPRAPLPPGMTSAPPPPPGTVSGAIRTDFEEMSMEEIKTIPPDFLESMTSVDRTRLGERVKELKRIAKMSPEERQTYLAKKQAEKELAAASEGLGSSLKSMLNDGDSLFAKMRAAADDSQLAGKGTFGDFATDFIYSYCFSCGKTLRNADEPATSCEYCGAEEELLVPDEEKTKYAYYECLSCKEKEPVPTDFTRGKPMIIRTRWKVPEGESVDHCPTCKGKEIRNISTNIMMGQDPDGQFAYYLTLFRLYQSTNSHFPPNLSEKLEPIGKLVQQLIDVSSKEKALAQTEEIVKVIMESLKWTRAQNFILQSAESDREVQVSFENLLKDLTALQDSDSPQHLHKMNEVGQFVGLVDRLLYRFIRIYETYRTDEEFVGRK